MKSINHQRRGSHDENKNPNTGHKPEGKQLSEILKMAREQLANRKATATVDYQRLLSGLKTGLDYADRQQIVTKLLGLIDLAGITLAEFDADIDWATVASPRKKLCYISASPNLAEPGPAYGLTMLYADDLCAHKTDISDVEFIAHEGQTDAVFTELVQVMADQQNGTPGGCAAGVKLLVDAGIGGGFMSKLTGVAQNEAKKIADKIPRLWALRLAVVEARIICTRPGARELPEVVLMRLGLANLLPDVVVKGNAPMAATSMS